MENTLCQIKLSIIVPVYNASKYISYTLDGLLNQGFSENSYEIICVDDGSSDSSPTILASYAKKYSCIRIITKENGGVSSARNAGLRAARGLFVQFFDADDLIIPRALSALTDVGINRNVDIVYSGYRSIPHNATDVNWSFNPTFVLKTIHGLTAPSHMTKMIIRREIIFKHSLLVPEDLRIGEDEIFSFLLFTHLEGEKMLYTDSQAYGYRIHEDSAMQTHYCSSDFVRHQTENFIKKIQICQKNYKSTELSKKQKKVFRKKISRLSASCVCFAARHNHINHLSVISLLKTKKLYPYHPIYCMQKYDQNNNAFVISKGFQKINIRYFFKNIGYNVFRALMSVEFLYKLYCKNTKH